MKKKFSKQLIIFIIALAMTACLPSKSENASDLSTIMNCSSLAENQRNLDLQGFAKAFSKIDRFDREFFLMDLENQLKWRWNQAGPYFKETRLQEDELEQSLKDFPLLNQLRMIGDLYFHEKGKVNQIVVRQIQGSQEMVWHKDQVYGVLILTLEENAETTRFALRPDQFESLDPFEISYRPQEGVQLALDTPDSGVPYVFFGIMSEHGGVIHNAPQSGNRTIISLSWMPNLQL